MVEPKFKSSFSSILKPLVSEEKDKYLALASLAEIRAFIPEIDTKINHDVVPIACNAFVVNRVNKNDDIIDTKTALEIAEHFKFKQINAEHNRKHVVGVILTVGFSEFGTDKPLTVDEVKDTITPFNVVLGGLVWRTVDDHVASVIEESNDPTSELYMKISASWELGFTGYEILILDAGQKNINPGLIISEATEVEKYRPFLKSLKGSGVLDDGRRVYRKPIIGVVPLGIGITEAPAAEVKGIATKTDDSKASDNTNNISQVKNSDVNIERNHDMKITTLQDITDESLKQCSASAVSDFLTSELKKGSDKWVEDKKVLDNYITQANADKQKLIEEQSQLKEQLKTLQANVDVLHAEKIEHEKVTKFNTRMTEIADVYDLDDEARAAIVEEIKALASDEDFDKWKKKALVLLKAFAKKKAPPFEEKKDGKKDESECKDCGKKHSGECEAKASTQNKNDVVGDVMDNAKKEKSGVPNSTITSEQTLKEKYASAFAKENFTIKL